MAAYVQRRKVWLMPTTRLPCSNAAETRNALKFAWVPQTRQQISAASRPKFAILYDHVGEILLFNMFFPIVYRCLSCEDIARETCAMVPRWRFLATFLDGHKLNFARGKIPSGARDPKSVYIAYQARKRPNIVQSLVDFRSATSLQ